MPEAPTISAPSAVTELSGKLCSFADLAKSGPPLISVLISNFNHSQYLPQSIQGILRQSYANFEIILTDDGSTDGGGTLVRKLARLDARIRPTVFPQNRGAMEATKHNMALAKGVLIYGGAADDFVLDENFFSRSIENLLQFPFAAGCFGVSGLLNAETNQLGGVMGHAPGEGLLHGVDAFRAFLRGHVFVAGNSSIWRRDAMETVNGFAYELGPQVDFWINHALPIVHGAVFFNKALACQRSYSANTNYGARGTLWEAASRFAKVEEMVRKIAPLYPECEADWIEWRARWMENAIEKTRGGRR